MFQFFQYQCWNPLIFSCLISFPASYDTFLRTFVRSFVCSFHDFHAGPSFFLPSGLLSILPFFLPFLPFSLSSFLPSFLSFFICFFSFLLCLFASLFFSFFLFQLSLELIARINNEWQCSTLHVTHRQPNQCF